VEGALRNDGGRRLVDGGRAGAWNNDSRVVPPGMLGCSNQVLAGEKKIVDVAEFVRIPRFT
jgi:hypothetical protein